MAGDMQVLEELYLQAERELGMAPEDVKEFLSAHYKGFNRHKVGEYIAALREEAARRAEEEERLASVVHSSLCPICGAPTIPDFTWGGRWTHTPGWRCRDGGLRHFLWAKANRIRRNQGLAPVFPELDPASGNHQSAG